MQAMMMAMMIAGYASNDDDRWIYKQLSYRYFPHHPPSAGACNPCGSPSLVLSSSLSSSSSPQSPTPPPSSAATSSQFLSTQYFQEGLCNQVMVGWLDLSSMESESDIGSMVVKVDSWMKVKVNSWIEGSECRP